MFEIFILHVILPWMNEISVCLHQMNSNCQYLKDSSYLYLLTYWRIIAYLNQQFLILFILFHWLSFRSTYLYLKLLPDNHGQFILLSSTRSTVSNPYLKRSSVWQHSHLCVETRRLWNQKSESKIIEKKNAL